MGRLRAWAMAGGPKYEQTGHRPRMDGGKSNVAQQVGSLVGWWYLGRILIPPFAEPPFAQCWRESPTNLATTLADEDRVPLALDSANIRFPFSDYTYKLKTAC